MHAPYELDVGFGGVVGERETKVSRPQELVVLSKESGGRVVVEGALQLVSERCGLIGLTRRVNPG